MECIFKIYNIISGDMYAQFTLNNIVKSNIIVDLECEIIKINNNIEFVLHYNDQLIYNDNIEEFIYNKLLDDQIVELTIYIVEKDTIINNYLLYNIYSIEFFDNKYTKLLQKYIYIKKDNTLCDYVSNKMDDYNFVLEIVSINGKALKYASDELKDDEDIVFCACLTYTYVIKYASDRLKNDREFIAKYVCLYDNKLEHLPDKFKDDFNIVLNSINYNFNNLEYVSDRLKDDNEIILTAITYSGDMLQHASDRLKDDYDVVLVAIEKYGKLLKLASNRLKDNEEIVLTAVNDYPKAIKYASDRLKDDKNFLLQLKLNSTTLKYISTRLMYDVDISVVAHTNDNWSNYNDPIIDYYEFMV